MDKNNFKKIMIKKNRVKKNMWANIVAIQSVL